MDSCSIIHEHVQFVHVLCLKTNREAVVCAATSVALGERKPFNTMC